MLKRQKLENEENTSTVRMRRRNAVLGVAAVIMTGDKKSSWAKLGTIFARTLFPEPVTPADLEPKNIRLKIFQILDQFGNNTRQVDNSIAKKLAQIEMDMPRQPSIRKSYRKKK